jgi:hypothetical protein
MANGSKNGWWPSRTFSVRLTAHELSEIMEEEKEVAFDATWPAHNAT